MRICPYCNEEIEDNIKICSVCGEALKEQSSITLNLNPKLCAIIGVLSLLLIGFSLAIISSVDISKAKDIIPTCRELGLENEDSTESMSAKEVIEIVNQQELLLKKYIVRKHSKQGKSIVFADFYDILSHSLYIVCDKMKEAWLDDYNPYFLSGVQVNKDLKIIQPEAPYLKVGNIGSWNMHVINFEYLIQAYSSYLSDDWNRYLELENEIHSITDNSLAWWDNEKNPALTTVFGWIISWEEFIKKYPRFTKNKDIKEELTFYIEAAIYRMCYNKDKEMVRKACHNFLNKVEKRTDSYRYIKEAYDILEKTNYDSNSDEFKNFLNKNEFDKFW